MTLSIPFLAYFKALLASRTSEGLEEELQFASDPVVRLSQMLVVTATRSTKRASCQMMLTEITPAQSCVGFRTTTKLQDGELLQVEFLLTGLGLIKSTATVQWVLAGSGIYKGQLLLAATPDQQVRLAEFCSRQRDGRR